MVDCQNILMVSKNLKENFKWSFLFIAELVIQLLSLKISAENDPKNFSRVFYFQYPDIFQVSRHFTILSKLGKMRSSLLSCTLKVT